jgi:hypothetical protein
MLENYASTRHISQSPGEMTLASLPVGVARLFRLIAKASDACGDPADHVNYSTDSTGLPDPSVVMKQGEPTEFEKIHAMRVPL